MLCDAVGEGLAPPESDLGFLNAFQKVLILPSGRSKSLPYGDAFRICCCKVDDIALKGKAFLSRKKPACQGFLDTLAVFMDYFFSRSRISVRSFSSLVGSGGAAGSSSFLPRSRRRLMALTMRKTTKAMIRKLMIALMKSP